MKLHVIVIAYERPVGLRLLIDCFLVQTNPNWIMTIVHDGPASKEVMDTMKLYNDSRISFIATEEREGNWGHSNRKATLQALNGNPNDFVLITNDDNYYVPKFVEYMLIEANGLRVAMVYCDFLHHTLGYINMVSQLKVNYIDMGAFIVDLQLAQEVGFNHDVPASDGLFAEECHAKCIQTNKRVTHIPLTLFVHN